ncbi:hypothetical protein F2P79_024080 [Pimephales promelas]|nr:hypothetical protein F2P79_024080 [Pimephales promelas]
MGRLRGGCLVFKRPKHPVNLRYTTDESVLNIFLHASSGGIGKVPRCRWGLLVHQKKKINRKQWKERKNVGGKDEDTGEGEMRWKREESGEEETVERIRRREEKEEEEERMWIGGENGRGEGATETGEIRGTWIWLEEKNGGEEQRKEEAGEVPGWRKEEMGGEQWSRRKGAEREEEGKEEGGEVPGGRKEGIGGGRGSRRRGAEERKEDFKTKGGETGEEEG